MEEPSPSTARDIDENALSSDVLPPDRFPAPSPSLSAVVAQSVNSNENLTSALHSAVLMSHGTGPVEHPSTQDGTTQAPSTYAGTTQAPSTQAETTQPPSTYAEPTQAPSTYAGTTQAPYTQAETTQLPSVYAGATQYYSDIAATNEASFPLTESSDHSDELNSPAQTELVSSEVAPIPPTGEIASEHENETSDRDESKRRELKQLFVHLNRVVVKQQKAIATAFGIAHAGNKKDRAARIYVILTGIMEREDKSAEEVLQDKGTVVGADFVTCFRDRIKIWCDDDEETEVPPMSELEKKSGVLQHPTTGPRTNLNSAVSGGSDGGGARANMTRENMTLEEFARLMLIFRDVPEAAADLRRSGQDLTREQLDLHTNRNAFWDSRIEPLFNDPQNVFRETFDGELRDIDPGRPVTTIRTGTCLQNMFNNFRREFTVIYKNWSVSGNLEPSSFVNFCYLPETTVLSKAGKRCLIAFRTFRLGTPHQNTLILDFGTKEMAEGSNAQLECGLVQNDGSISGSKRRRSSSNELNNALVNALNTFSADSRNTKETSAGKKRKEELDALAVQSAKLENNRKRIDSMATVIRYTKEIEPTARPDPRILGIFRTYCGKLADEMEEDLLGNE